MTRLFVPLIEEKEGDLYTLKAEDSHYIASVLRMRPGEELTLVDPSGKEALSRVHTADPKACVLSLESFKTNESESPVKITLFQSVSKGERMDLTIQKSVELGVSSIVPVFSERCVVRPDKGGAKSSKNDRWQKIALEAARQSGRGIVPEVCPSMSFKEALKKAKDEFGLVLFPWEEEKAMTLKSVLEKYPEAKDIAVFIGPEGGYAASEAELAESFGAHKVTIGKRILRTETAGPAVLSMLLYHYEM